jgi:acetolactate synthase I/II/III large subunit
VTGAEALARTAVAGGIDMVFTNPGTTETHLVAAFEAEPGVRQVLCLFEGVCTGAADGYGRIAGKPAVALMHMGPGLANGLANLHNARRGGAPLVAVVGDHARSHRNVDAPLTSDIASLAGAMSDWVRTTGAPDEVSRDMAAAIAVAQRGAVATLVVPTDCQWSTVDAPIVSIPPWTCGFYEHRVAETAEALQAATPSRAALLIGGRLDEATLRAADRVAHAVGCRLLVDRAPQFQVGSVDVPAPERLEFPSDLLAQQLAALDLLVLAGAELPKAFFATTHSPNHPVQPDTRVQLLAEPEDDVLGALQALVEVLGGPEPDPSSREPVTPPTGALTRESLAAVVGSTQPSGALVVDEAITSGFPYRRLLDRCPPHTWVPVTGGAIGFGLPAAIGVALAAPERTVLALVGDGSAMYTIQALWTQARLGLEVTTIICSNRRYAILAGEYQKAGFGDSQSSAAHLFELQRPELRWPELSASMGVPGTSVNTAEGLRAALMRALEEPGPHLIEAQLVP